MKTYIVQYFYCNFCKHQETVEAENSSKALEKANALHEEKYKIGDWIINSQFSIKVTTKV